MALVPIARLPCERPITMLHVVEEVTLILIAVRPFVLFPLPSAIFDPISEVSDVAGPIVPLVSAEAMRFAELILASVNIPILERVCSLAMLETVDKFTLIPITVLPLMHTIAMILSVFPLADV